MFAHGRGPGDDAGDLRAGAFNGAAVIVPQVRNTRGHNFPAVTGLSSEKVDSVELFGQDDEASDIVPAPNLGRED
jgi:hypothetical protein